MLAGDPIPEDARLGLDNFSNGERDVRELDIE